MATAVDWHISLVWLNWSPENPPFGAGILVISHKKAELNADFLLKFSNFCYHGNNGGFSKKFEGLRLIGWPPKPPVWCKKCGTYVKFDQIYSKFCVKICRFSLPWQQELVWHKVHFYHNDDQQSQWETGILTHCRSETPENFITKIGHNDYIAGGNTHAKFYGNRPRSVRPTNSQNITSCDFVYLDFPSLSFPFLFTRATLC